MKDVIKNKMGREINVTIVSMGLNISIKNNEPIIVIKLEIACERLIFSELAIVSISVGVCVEKFERQSLKLLKKFLS